MRIKTLASAAAIALAATVGSASAAERFTTLEGIAADALTPQEMGVVIGAAEGDLTVSPAANGHGDPNGRAGGTAGGATRATGKTGGFTNSNGVVVFAGP